MFLSKYGVARHIYVPLVKRGLIDFAISSDYAFAAGDAKISKDGGAFTNVTNAPTAINSANQGAVWDFSLTATEMQAAQVIVVLSDATSGKAVEDQSFIVETYGNASAEHPFDLATATQAVTIGAGGIASTSYATDAIGAAAVSAAAVTKVVNGVWDEPASSHVTAGTMASVARIIFSGHCLAGSTATVINLDSTASSVTGAYAGRVAMLLHGNGEGQAMPIASYDGPSKALTLAHALDFTPDATTYIAIG